MDEKRNDGELYYFIYFKKLYESWEKTMSHALKLWMRTPLFTNSMVNAMEKSVEFNNYMREIMELTLKQRDLRVKGKDINRVDTLKSKQINSSEHVGESRSKNGLTSKHSKSGKIKSSGGNKDESRKV
jgi:hypothetical protein